MKVLKPSKNRQTQGYSDNHKGYDHSGKGDQNYYSSFHGVVVQAKNSETKNWINNGELTTTDYGNYIKIKANVDGKTVYQLGAHFKQGTVLPKGTEVSKGQVIAQIGNTGNSTAQHCHTEYRDENNYNFSVEFTEEKEEETKKEDCMDKKQQYTEAYIGTRPQHPPSEDEINFRLQENKGLLTVIQDILTGDTKAREYWLKEWNINTTDPNMDYKTLAEEYKLQIEEIKHDLGLSISDNVEEVRSKIIGLIDRNDRLMKQLKPEVIYKSEGKDFDVAFNFWNLKVIIEKERETK